MRKLTFAGALTAAITLAMAAQAAPAAKIEDHFAQNGAVKIHYVAEGKGPLVTRFPLVFEVERHGETVAYKYAQVANKSYLQEVAFAGGASKYTFDLIQTASNIYSYKHGFRQDNGRLVGSVRSTYHGQLRNRWCFLYDGPGENGLGHALKTAPECSFAAQGVPPCT